MYKVLRGGCDSRHPANFLLSRPEGLDHYIVLIVKSPAAFTIGENHFSLRVNSAVFIDPHIPYEYSSLGENYVNDWLHFAFDEAEQEQMKELPLRQPIALGSPSLLTSYIRQILWENSYAPSQYRDDNVTFLIRVLFNNLLSLSNGEKSRQEPFVYHPLYAGFQNLRLNLQATPEREYHAKELADSLGISASYFQALYKEFFQRSWKSDLIDIRLDYAKSLLRATNFKIEQIAAMSGYTNEVHFYRQFREKTGMTPHEFRKQPFRAQ